MNHRFIRFIYPSGVNNMIHYFTDFKQYDTQVLNVL